MRDKKERGRRRVIIVRYKPATCNKCNAIFEGSIHTNNGSEGWHDHFQILGG